MVSLLCIRKSGINITGSLLWTGKATEGILIHTTLKALNSHRIEVLHSVGCKSSSYVRSCCHTCQRMPIAHRLAHGHYVWTEILTLQLERPEVISHASKPRLHLICHKHSASGANISAKSMKGEMPHHQCCKRR